MITARSQSLEVKNQLQQVVADLFIFKQKLQSLLNTNAALLTADTVLKRIDFAPIADSSILNDNPSLAYEKQQIEVAHLERKLEQSKILPDLKIGYFSQTIQGTQEINGLPRTFNTGDRFSGIQAGVSIPLWFAPNRAKTKAAKLKEQQTQTYAEYYSKSLQGNFRALMGEYAKYSNSIDYYEKQAIPEADLIIEQATRSYRAGAMDYTDYIISLSRALSIKQNYLEALNNFNQTIISIDFVQGKLF